MPEFTVTTTMDSTEKNYCLLNDILECQKDAFLSNISFDSDIEFTSSGSALVHVKAYYTSADDCAVTHAFNTTFDFSVNNNSNIVKLNKLQNFIKSI